MIDIHCHLLYGVDDGAATREVSVMMLQEAAKQGITDIILTPHYRKGMFPFDTDQISENYDSIRPVANEAGIRLYLGCEYHVNSDMVDNLRIGRAITMAGTDYVLAEYSSDSSAARIQNSLDDLLSNGYIPIIAHAERYGAVAKDTGILAQFRRMGALVQINANSILGYDGFALKRICKRILRSDLADIAASDSHDMSGRRCRMSECMKYVEKKYGQPAADRLFVRNPGRIIEGTQSTIE